MAASLVLVGYCVLVVIASVLGGLAPRWLFGGAGGHTRMQLVLSAVAGFMLGVAVLHMVPHALFDASPGPVMGWLLAGLLVMFLTQRFFAFHHHDVPPPEDGSLDGAAAGHHHAGCEHEVPAAHVHRLSWSGAAVGLSLHSIIGGVALAAAWRAEAPGSAEAGRLWLPGLAVFLVTILHKPLDALTVLTLARSAGHRPWTSHLINAGFALMVPAGVAMFLLGFGVADAGGAVVAYALAFSAGTFLCISLSDLLPELQFHAHDRFKLTAALAVGLLAAGTIAYVEGSTDAHDHHGHGHGQEQPVPLEQRLPGLDGHDGHDHEGHGHPH